MPRRTWVALLLLIAFDPVAHAQSTKVSLAGRITDRVRAAILEAKVAAVSTGTNVRFETTTNAVGEYFLPNIPPSLYRIEIEKSGFKS
jgi:hypothetical protein